MNEFEEVPETYEAENDDFTALYILAWALIIKALMRLVSLPPNLNTTQMLFVERQVNTEIEAVISNLERKAIPMATEKVSNAYKEGVAFSRKAMTTEIKLTESKEVELNNSHKLRMEKMIEQTQDDLLKATHNTKENVKQLVRKVVSKEIADAGKSNKFGKNTAMAKQIEKQLRKQFIENGIKDADVAIIDKANRKWKLQTYSAMVARTKMNNAYIDAIREEAIQDGTDLAIISTKPDTKDACKNYEGMIISLNGITSGYLTYAELKASKQVFHPNCGHFVRPISNLNRVPKKLMEQHQKQMNSYTGNQS
jgi:hypothetical protein